jgi:hypothetical protein
LAFRRLNESGKDVAGFEERHGLLRYIGAEVIAIISSSKTLREMRRSQRGALRMCAIDCAMQRPADAKPWISAAHTGLDPSLIDEDQPVRIAARLS